MCALQTESFIYSLNFSDKFKITLKIFSKIISFSEKRKVWITTCENTQLCLKLCLLQNKRIDFIFNYSSGRCWQFYLIKQLWYKAGVIKYAQIQLSPFSSPQGEKQLSWFCSCSFGIWQEWVVISSFTIIIRLAPPY